MARRTGPKATSPRARALRGKLAEPRRQADIDYAALFRDGVVATRAGARLSVRPRRVGELDLPSGRIVACDPFTLDREPKRAFATTVAPGRYQVVLSLATRGDEPFKVAAAMLRASDAPVARWTAALCPGQDPAKLPAGAFFGYGAEAGTGCFVDAETAVSLFSMTEDLGDDAGEIEDMPGALAVRDGDELTVLPRGFDERTMPPLRELGEGWEEARSGLEAQELLLEAEAVPLVFKPSEERLRAWLDETVVRDGAPWGAFHDGDGWEADLVAFSTGLGNGVFASYWGLDAEGRPVALVTDFAVAATGPCRELVFDIGAAAPGVARLSHQALKAAGLDVEVSWPDERSVALSVSGAGRALHHASLDGIEPAALLRGEIADVDGGGERLVLRLDRPVPAATRLRIGIAAA